MTDDQSVVPETFEEYEARSDAIVALQGAIDRCKAQLALLALVAEAKRKLIGG